MWYKKSSCKLVQNEKPTLWDTIMEILSAYLRLSTYCRRMMTFWFILEQNDSLSLLSLACSSSSFYQKMVTWSFDLFCRTWRVTVISSKYYNQINHDYKFNLQVFLFLFRKTPRVTGILPQDDDMTLIPFLQVITGHYHFTTRW